MNETSKIIDQNEKVIWEGRPQFSPYIISIFPVMIFGLLWTSFSSFFLYLVMFKSSGTPLFAIIFVSLFVFIGLTMLIWSPLYRILAYKYIWYVITDKRVIFQRGLIGRDFVFSDYDKIESAAVDVGILDKIFGRNSGTIFIGSSRYGNMSMSNITDPYNVFELFKKVSFDVKADINYPNALRPQENKGYQTEYQDKGTKSN